MQNNPKTIEEKIAELEQRIVVLEKAFTFKERTAISQSLSTDSKDKGLSAKEFLLQKKPKGDIQRTFYLGGYLEKIKGMGSFTVEDLKEVFRSAKAPLPENLNDKVNKNIGKGLFMEAKNMKENKKAWVLTATGETCLSSIQKEE